MRRLLQFFIRQRAFVELLTIGVIAVGIVSAYTIQKAVFPNITFDWITISTVFPGATAKEVENLVTNPLEQDLREVDGVEEMTSTSIAGSSSIFLRLDPDETTEEEAQRDIQNIVDRFGKLPENAEQPVVTVIETKMIPIIQVALTRTSDVSELQLREIARKMERELETIPGVARVDIRGLRDLEIHVIADQEKLRSKQISLSDLIRTVRSSNVSIPGGTISARETIKAGTEITVRAGERYESPMQVANTVVRANELGTAIRIADVAEVKYALDEPKFLTLTNGSPSLNLVVLQKEKADSLKLVEKLKQRVEELKGPLPKGVSYRFVDDLSDFIGRRLSILGSNLIFGVSFVILILPLIVPFRFALVIAAGIPFAFLGAITVLYVSGYSINLISMMGLVIVIGMLVDDAIVVTENAARLINDGQPSSVAALNGAMDVIRPVLASVTTTIIVFLPMLLMSGIIGKYIEAIPIAVIAALSISVMEAFFILPTHIAYWAKEKNRTKKERSISKLMKVTAVTRSYWDNKVQPGYLKAVKKVVQHRYVAVGAITVIFILSVFMASQKMKIVLFPPGATEVFYIRTQAPVGTSLQKHYSLVKPIEAELQKLPDTEVKTFVTLVGSHEHGEGDIQAIRGSEYAQITVELTPPESRDRSTEEIIEGLRSKIGITEGLTNIAYQRESTGPPVGKPVSIGIMGSEYSSILSAVEIVKQTLREVNGVSDIEDSFVRGKKELKVGIVESESAASAVTEEEVGLAVRAAFEGVEATTIQELEEEVAVRGILSKPDRDRIATINEVNVTNSAGDLISLKNVTKLEEQETVGRYEHLDNRRQVRVTAEVNTDLISSTEATELVRTMIPKIKAGHPDLQFDFGGEEEETQESIRSLRNIFFVALLGIFLILVLTFNNLLQPFLILLTVPLGITAVIIVFFIHRMPLSFLGILGIIALSGVIANNAIVLVDFVNQKRRAGFDRLESIFEAAKVRLKPIFLTTMTTVAGIMPTAYGLGGRDPFVVPIARALGWGILVGSLLTMFVFPAALAVVDDIMVKISKKK